MTGEQAVRGEVRAPRRGRLSLAPAWLAAVGLHLAVFLIATLAPRPDMSSLGPAVPITIVSRAPTTDSRPAQAAPETAAAQTETPVPAARAPTPPPEDAPAPPAPRPPPMKTRKPKVQPKVQPSPTPPEAPSPKLVKPVPKPKPKTQVEKKPPRTEPMRATAADQPTPKHPTEDTFNLDALAANIARSHRPSPPRPAMAARGPTRQETAPAARVDAGQGVSQSDIAGLSQLLERLWNPNCNVAGGDAVVIPVRFTVGDDGHVVGSISEGGRDASANPVMSAAARRAIDAVHQAEPYGAVYRGKAFTVNFDAKTACAGR